MQLVFPLAGQEMFSFFQQGLVPSVPSAVVALTPSLVAVAQDNLLALYRTVPLSKDSGETRLEWVCESRLLGNVSSMCSLTALGKPLLALSFADAKVLPNTL